jgi:hypothetical protein
MKSSIALLALCLAAMPTAAEVYKCKKPDGSLAYQEAPCAPDTAGAKVDLKVPAAQPPSPNKGDRNAMKDAYESHMAKRDYEGAVTFAGNDKEKHRALKLAEDKRQKCGKLSIRAQEARANVKPKNPRSENAAIAAEREYNLACR